MRVLTAALGAVFLWAALSAAAPAQADDTHVCLDEFTGPVTVVSGDQGHSEYDKRNFSAGARFDARSATWLEGTYPSAQNQWPMTVGTSRQGDPICVAGGVIRGTNDEGLSWSQSKKNNSSSVLIKSYGEAIVDGWRIHNGHDAFNSLDTDTDFTIRNNWVTYNRDDCVENDFNTNALVEDNLFDGCYVFLSSREASGETGQVSTIRNNLIRLQVMPEPYGHDGEGIMGHGPLFKYEADSPHLVIEDNIFLIEDFPSTKFGRDHWEDNAPVNLGFREEFGQLKSCSNNIIVWLGPGEFPGNVPDHCTTITDDRSIWDEAVAKWKADHPKVARIADVDGDDPIPGPDPDPTPDPDPDPDPTPDPDFDARLTALEEENEALKGRVAIIENQVINLTNGQIDMNATLNEHSERLDAGAAGLK